MQVLLLGDSFIFMGNFFLSLLTFSSNFQTRVCGWPAVLRCKQYHGIHLMLWSATQPRPCQRSFSRWMKRKTNKVTCPRKLRNPHKFLTCIEWDIIYCFKEIFSFHNLYLQLIQWHDLWKRFCNRHRTDCDHSIVKLRCLWKRFTVLKLKWSNI